MDEVTRDLDALELAAPPGQVDQLEYSPYAGEGQLSDIMALVDRDLSEPYSIFTYRYFLVNWPSLCFLATAGGKTVGTIVCKADENEDGTKYGYIAMLAVDKNFRKHGIGTELATRAIRSMARDGCKEVVLETEVTNGAALCLYGKQGFTRDERLMKYYLNGVDAFRLKLWLHPSAPDSSPLSTGDTG
ncbi:unnamed protein product [Chrysoparadoxa australica]